jgi:hypothetical protein
MPYSITTKDGITVNNIPDDVAPDHASLKARVAAARAQRDGQKAPVSAQTPGAMPSPQASPRAAPDFSDEALGPTKADLAPMAVSGSKGLEDLRTGVANSGINTYLGASQLFGPLSEEQKRVKAMSDADTKEAGGWGTAGKVMGDIGTGIVESTLTPQVAIPKYLKMALGSGLSAFGGTPVDENDDMQSILKAKAIEAAKAAGPQCLQF